MIIQKYFGSLLKIRDKVGIIVINIMITWENLWKDNTRQMHLQLTSVQFS